MSYSLIYLDLIYFLINTLLRYDIRSDFFCFMNSIVIIIIITLPYFHLIIFLFDECVEDHEVANVEDEEEHAEDDTKD